MFLEYNDDFTVLYNGRLPPEKTTLTDADLKPSCHTIGADALKNNPTLEKVDLSWIKIIEGGALSNCPKLRTVTLDSATDIGSLAFSRCPELTEVKLRDATQIGTMAFLNCIALKTIDLLRARSLESQIFSYCQSLSTARFTQELQSLHYYAFKESPASLSIVVDTPETQTRVRSSLPPGRSAHVIIESEAKSDDVDPDPWAAYYSTKVSSKSELLHYFQPSLEDWPATSEPGLCSYWSTPNYDVSNNCIFTFKYDTRETIVCLHFANYFLVLEARKLRGDFGATKAEQAASIGHYRNAFISPDSIDQAGLVAIQGLSRGNFLHKTTYYYLIDTTDPTEHNTGLGKALYQACHTMGTATELTKFFLFFSQEHVMAVVVRLKESEPTAGTKLPYFSVKFFDPNSTLTHYRFVAHTREDLLKISLYSALEAFPQRAARYFGAPSQSAFATRTEDNAPGGLLIECADILSDFTHSDTVFPKTLILPTGDNDTLLANCLHLLLSFGLPVKDALRTILNSTIPLKQKVKALTAKNKDGVPGLYLAFIFGPPNLGTIQDYVKAILGSTHLDTNSKKELLAAKFNHRALLSHPLITKHSTLVKVYSDAILGSGLPQEVKDELLEPHKVSIAKIERFAPALTPAPAPATDAPAAWNQPSAAMGGAGGPSDIAPWPPTPTGD